MGNPTFCPLVSTGCSLRISECQHITSIFRLFSWEIKVVFFLCYLLPEMSLSGQGLIVILLSDSFRIKLRYYISVALKAFARFCVWERLKLHFPWISGHKVLWPLSAAASVPCALKGGCGTASCSPACRVLQARPAGKKYLADLGSSPQNWGWDVKTESGELG